MNAESAPATGGGGAVELLRLAAPVRDNDADSGGPWSDPGDRTVGAFDRLQGSVHVPRDAALAFSGGVAEHLPGGRTARVPSPAHEKDADIGCVWGHHPDMPAGVLKRLQAAVRMRTHSCFAFSNADLPGYCGVEGPFTLELKTDRAVFVKPRFHSAAERLVQDAKCKELLAAGIIVGSNPTIFAACPTMPAKKDADGNWSERRFCIDFRGLNEETVADRYALPLPEEIFQRVGDAKFFTKIDMRAGFHQIPIAEADQHKTAFWWGNQTYHFKRMPFGLVNASAKFQRVMDAELQRAGLSHCATAFIDDVLIWSDTAEQHVEDVSRVLDALAAVGLRAHPEKSIFGAAEVEYLGHNIGSYGMTPHEAKVAAIKALPVPTSASQLLSVLGFINYYRVYCPNFASTAQPLYSLLKKGAHWQWGPAQQTSLDTLKGVLTEEGRALKRVVKGQPLILHTDWSVHGIGAVLGQVGEDGQEYMCACASRSLNQHERHYSSYQGEMLAAVWAVRTFRPYLHGMA
jgi:hypothetical protein